jgi:hypothetical protein
MVVTTEVSAVSGVAFDQETGFAISCARAAPLPGCGNDHGVRTAIHMTNANETVQLLELPGRQSFLVRMTFRSVA